MANFAEVVELVIVEVEVLAVKASDGLGDGGSYGTPVGWVWQGLQTVGGGRELAGSRRCRQLQRLEIAFCAERPRHELEYYLFISAHHRKPNMDKYMS